MLGDVLALLAERYSTRGYLASGKITWDGLGDKLRTKELDPLVRRLAIMGAVLADRGGVALTVPMRLEVLDAPVLRRWAQRVEAIGREDFRDAAQVLVRSEIAAVLGWVVDRGGGLDERALEVAAGIAGALTVQDVQAAPMAYTVVAWHPGAPLAKLDWLMRQEPGSIGNAVALQAQLFRYVPSRNGGPMVPLPIALLKSGATLPMQRPASDFERGPLRVVTTGKPARQPGEHIPHKCSPNCTHPAHRA